MRKITVHRNINVNWPRYHTFFYTNFINDFLKPNFQVEEINWAKGENGEHVLIQFPHECGSLKKSPILYDVDCAIVNEETKKYVVMSFGEYFNHGVVHFLKNDYCEKVLLTHFNSSYLYDRLKRDGISQKYNVVSPWFFGSFCKYDINKWRDIRNSVEKKDKLFFRGSGLDSYRKTVKMFAGKEYFLGPYGTSEEQYFSDMCNAKIGLSHYMDLDMPVNAFQHCGEYCYRDMEYMSIGLPFIRIEFTDSLYNDLIPGKHYISIPRDKAWVAYTKEGNAGVAKLYEEYYNKFKDDEEYLKLVSKNQLEWYDNNCLWPASGKLTWDLLNLNSWK